MPYQSSYSDAVPADAGVGLYGDYRAVTTYERVEGTLVIPCCDGDPVVVETHSPYRVKRVSYSGSGKGRPPVFPRPADDAVLLSHAHAEHLPTPMQSPDGGGWVYFGGGEYAIVEPVNTLSAEFYECPRFPQHLQPMKEEMEQAGFRYTPSSRTLGESILSTYATFDPTNPKERWPSALTLTPEFFSDKLA